MLRELARLACLGLPPGDRVCAFLGGAVGGGLSVAWVLLANQRHPHLFDHFRPH